MIRVCVAGGGPAGLSAAIHAARAGAAVTLLERNRQCGIKLLAAGGGRCNLSNTRLSSEWPPLFGGNGRFILPAMETLPLEGLRDFFAGIGQPLGAPDGFHLYPASNSARAVRDALVAETTRLGAEIRYGKRIEALSADNDGVDVATGDGESSRFDKLILAVGGRCRPATGSTGDGSVLAEKLGYRIAPGAPGLVGLRADNLPGELAGLVLPDAEARLKARGKAALRGAGELLLTHNGISGPAVLNLSGTVAELLGETDAASPKGAVVLSIQWIAGMPPASWLEEFEAWRRGDGGSGVGSLLRPYLPRRLAGWLCGLARVEDSATASNLRADARNRLAELLGRFPARIIGTEGWDRAMITRGGVDCKQVDPRTMEGRVTRNVFFAGEVLDVDGPCGGYNLHWAFASGALAGMRAAGCGNVPDALRRTD